MVVGSASVAFLIAMLVVNSMSCRPVPYFWTHLGQATCIDMMAYYFYVSVFNFILDVLVLVLPLREVGRLQVSKWRKLGISGVFLLGSM